MSQQQTDDRPHSLVSWFEIQFDPVSISRKAFPFFDL